MRVVILLGPLGSARPSSNAPGPSSAPPADSSRGAGTTPAASAGGDYEVLLAQSELDLELAREEITELMGDLADVRDSVAALNAQLDEFRRAADEINEQAGQLHEAQHELEGMLANDGASERPDSGPVIGELSAFITQVCKDPAVENCSSAEAAVDSLAADEESEALRQQNFEDRLAEFNKTLSNLAADLDDVATGISENLR